MKYFTLFTAVVFLVLSASGNTSPSWRLPGSTTKTDTSEPATMSRTYSLFIPSGTLIIKEAIAAYEEGC